MSERPTPELLLGKNTPVVEQYAPGLLYPIPRSEGRNALGVGANLPFSGCDVWHAYELSWLDSQGLPQARIGRFTFPADSSNMVESKSFKLYLNSLNNHAFESESHMRAVVVEDLGRTVGASVQLEVLALDDPELAGATLQGLCLDTLTPAARWASPEAAQLSCDANAQVEEVLYSHLLRSLCPVTGQPDWASLRIAYRGGAIDHCQLLGYILAYRNHQEFHEQCIERIFCDITRQCAPEALSVQGFYTRRGGLDINPYRSSGEPANPLPRLHRQ